MLIVTVHGKMPEDPWLFGFGGLWFGGLGFRGLGFRVSGVTVQVLRGT